MFVQALEVTIRSRGTCANSKQTLELLLDQMVTRLYLALALWNYFIIWYIVGCNFLVHRWLRIEAQVIGSRSMAFVW